MEWKFLVTCWHKTPWILRVVGVIASAWLARCLLLAFEPTIYTGAPVCYFHQLTGLNCAGCGGTRAFFAFLKGDLALSWRMNPLFLTGLACGLLFGTLALLDRRPGGRPRCLAGIRLSARLGWFALGFILSFWILRNLPWWPFTQLSPP